MEERTYKDYSLEEKKNQYSAYNAEPVLKAVEKCIVELEEVSKQDSFDYDHKRFVRKGWEGKKVFKMRAVCDDLSIFDWWSDELSMSQLKQMKAFLTQAIKLGFTGYVCFKVGIKGCANGMWAHTKESTTGFSPKDCDILYHSFVSCDNYYSVCVNNTWAMGQLNLKQVKEYMKVG